MFELHYEGIFTLLTHLYKLILTFGDLRILNLALNTFIHKLISVG